MIQLKFYKSAFSDKTTQHFSVIKNLFNLKISSVQIFYLRISELQHLPHQIDRLGIERSVFAQTFLWRNMNESFK